MTLPNFLIIGAPKCGTTSVYHYLAQHPDVFLPSNKEPRFFAYEGGVPDYRGPGDLHREENTVIERGAYERLFGDAGRARAVGEASAIYLYLPASIPRIRDLVPRAKLIALLRNPVDRAYSNFMHQAYHGREPHRDFARALAEEDRRVADNWGPFWHYARVGRYHEQLQRYFAVFPREQIGVYLFDDLVGDAARLLRHMFGFLEVDAAFVPDVSRRYMVGGVPKVGLLARVIYTPSRLKDRARPFVPEGLRRRLIAVESRLNRARAPLQADLRGRLTEVFREEILRLQDLIDRDLSGWLAPRTG